jgi:hypothetical protein
VISEITTTQRHTLKPIIGPREHVHKALQSLKTRHGNLEAIEYPHEIAPGRWRTVVSVPQTTNTQREQRPAPRPTVRRRSRAKTIGITALITSAVALVAVAVWTVVTLVAWTIAYVTAHLSTIIGVGALVLVLACAGGGKALRCVHADHH